MGDISQGKSRMKLVWVGLLPTLSGANWPGASIFLFLCVFLAQRTELFVALVFAVSVCLEKRACWGCTLVGTALPSLAPPCLFLVPFACPCPRQLLPRTMRSLLTAFPPPVPRRRCFFRQALAKQFGLPYLDVQAILTLKIKAKENVETIEG